MAAKRWAAGEQRSRSIGRRADTRQGAKPELMGGGERTERGEIRGGSKGGVGETGKWTGRAEVLMERCRRTSRQKKILQVFKICRYGCLVLQASRICTVLLRPMCFPKAYGTVWVAFNILCYLT